MSRQHALPPRPRHQAPKSSVWIDPTVSTYLQGEQPVPGRDQSVPGRDQSGPYGQGEPTSPIPPRASAQRLRAVRVRPRYSYARTPESDGSELACIPALPPPTTWQYESQDFTAESSLSSLSLIVDAPTHPQAEIPGTRNTPHPGMLRIEEMNTHPSVIARDLIESTGNVAQRAIEEHDTVPMQLSPTREDRANRPNGAGNAGGSPLPGAASLFLGDAIAPVSSNNLSSRALAPIVPAAMPVVMGPQNRQIASAEPASWTAGAGAGSRYAQLVAAHTGNPGRQRHHLSFNIFDRVRWWLLHPGRFEFLLWLGGTLLLMTVTCIFLLMTVFSVQWNAADSNNGASASANGSQSAANGQTTPADVSLVLTNTGSLLAGQPLHLRGQGFSANSHIALTYDANQPFLNQDRQPVVAQTDAHGTFAVTLNSPAWKTGQHRITARDLATGYRKTVLITVADAITTPTTVTPGAGAGAGTATPVVTATTTTQQGNNTPPITGTPTVVPPTVGITQTPKPPTPTPTRGITPTATVGITPTPGASVTPKVNGTATPGASVTPKVNGTATVGVNGTPPVSDTATVGASMSPTVNSTATVGSANPATISSEDIATSGETGITVGPWLWLLIGGYALAMLLFGLAGLARKRS